MLCIWRNINQKTYVTVPPSTEETVIEFTMVESNYSGAKVGYTAPRNVVVDREEVHQDKQREKRDAAARNSEKV